MTWRWLASNARILVGVSVGAFGVAAMITGRIGVGSPASLLCLALAAYIIADPIKTNRITAAYKEGFKNYLDCNLDQKARVDRGRRPVMWANGLYAAAIIWALIAGYTGAPLLLSLLAFLPAVGLHFRGMGEVAAVEGQFMRDYSPSE